MGRTSSWEQKGLEEFRMITQLWSSLYQQTKITYVIPKSECHPLTGIIDTMIPNWRSLSSELQRAIQVTEYVPSRQTGRNGQLPGTNCILLEPNLEQFPAEWSRIVLHEVTHVAQTLRGNLPLLLQTLVANICLSYGIPDYYLRDPYEREARENSTPWCQDTRTWWQEQQTIVETNRVATAYYQKKRRVLSK